jgi:hypothetical protein
MKLIHVRDFSTKVRLKAFCGAKVNGEHWDYATCTTCIKYILTAKEYEYRYTESKNHLKQKLKNLEYSESFDKLIKE